MSSLSIPNFIIFYFDITYSIQCLTIGFFVSFGLIHLTKNGLHCPNVFINCSKDFLNWEDKVGVRLRVSDPIFKSELNICCKNLFLDTCISWSKSAEKLSLFFSRNPLVS